MKKRLILFRISLFLILILATASLWGIAIRTDIDWKNVIEELMVASFVAVLFGSLFPCWQKYRNKPKDVRLIESEIGYPMIRLSPSEMGADRFFCADLRIHNHQSKKPLLHGVYWHIFIPKHIDFRMEQSGAAVQFERRSHSLYWYLSGYVPDVIYPEQSARIGYKLIGQLPAAPSKADVIFYWLATEYGLYPTKLRSSDISEDPETVRVERLGVLEI